MTYGKPDPGVPDVRAAISRKQEAMGLPPLAPATDTVDGPDGAAIVQALAHLDHAQTAIDAARDILTQGRAAPDPYPHGSASKAPG